jgi:hypothetical protein
MTTIEPKNAKTSLTLAIILMTATLGACASAPTRSPHPAEAPGLDGTRVGTTNIDADAIAKALGGKPSERILAEIARNQKKAIEAEPDDNADGVTESAWTEDDDGKTYVRTTVA